MKALGLSLWVFVGVLLGLLACCRQAAPAPKPATTQELEAQSSGATLHVRVAGDLAAERVLVAIHGGPGMSSDYMLSLEQLAGEDLALVTYDQRGTGRSTEPSDGYAMERYVEDLDAVRQAVGADAIHLFGHSWGGLVAQRYAIAHPDRVRSIVLMGSGAPSMEAMHAGNEHKVQRIIALQQQGILPEEIRSLADLLTAYYADPRFEVPDELRDPYYNGAVEQQTWAALGDYDFSADVAVLTHPVLLLWGEGDPFGVQMAWATQDALLNAEVEFVLLEGCGHFWHECPDQVYDRIRAFLGVE
jgi:pimeloyl-ACP methyl ester carboxylesterase